MTLVLITGNSGTGKSAVRAELLRRRETSFDTDEDGIASWRLRSTGEEVYDPGAGNHPDDWLDRHGWMVHRSRVEDLARLARDRLVFLCGSVENEDEVWDLFDSVVCLVLDDRALERRIASRTTNAFGKQPTELAAILEWNPTMAATYRQRGALVVDAAQPLATVVDQILAHARR